MAMATLVFPAALLRAVIAAGEAAYPAEACGLLVGRTEGRGLLVTRVAASANLAAAEGRADRFEIDPRLRFQLMRELGEDGPERLIGHYHSHPDHPARPSKTDRAMAWEPELVWVITAVTAGRAARTRAYRVDPGGGGFRALALITA